MDFLGLVFPHDLCCTPDEFLRAVTRDVSGMNSLLIAVTFFRGFDLADFDVWAGFLFLREESSACGKAILRRSPWNSFRLAKLEVAPMFGVPELDSKRADDGIQSPIQSRRIPTSRSNPLQRTQTRTLQAVRKCLLERVSPAASGEQRSSRGRWWKIAPRRSIG